MINIPILLNDLIYYKKGIIMFYESIITLEVKHSQYQGKKKVNDYVIGKRLGEGSFGLVRAVTRLYKEPDDDNVYT